MSKTLLELAGATAEASSDDALAGTLTAEIAGVGGGDVVVVAGGSAPPARGTSAGKEAGTAVGTQKQVQFTTSGSRVAGRSWKVSLAATTLA